MPISAGTVAAALTLETKGFQTGLDKARSLIKTLQSDTLTANEKVKALGMTMQGLGKGLTLSVTASVIGLGTAAVKTFTGFDDAMRQVRATMNATADETEALTQAAKDAGATTRYSASEAASALNYLALAGYDSEKAIAALPDVLRLAQAGGMDLAYTSDLLTDSMSALGKDSSHMTTFADQMTRASQRSNTSIAQLGEGILTVGGLAKNLAGDTVELNTALGLLADNGIKGAEGGTHLRNILLALSGATEGSEKALKALGVRAFDETGKMRPLADTFADLSAAMANMTDDQRTKTITDIFRTTDVAAVNALLATSADRWTELGGAISDSSGAAQAAADIMEGGIGGAFRSMKSAVEAVAVEFGENLAPMVQSAAEKVTGLARGFASLSEDTQNMILRVAAFAAAAGPTLIVLGKLTTAAGTLMKLFSGPAGWVMLGVGAVGALAVAIAKARGEMDGFHDAANKALANTDDERVDRLSHTIEVDTSVIGVGKSVYDQLVEDLPNIYDAIGDALTDGKPDDAATMAELRTKVTTYYGSLRAEVQAWAEAELAKLDINSATYEQDAQNIRDSAANMIAELDDLESKSITWMDENAGRSTSAVKSHMGELDAIEARAETVLATIRKTTASWNDLEERNIERVKAGTATSDEAVAMALGTVEERKRAALEQAETQKAEQLTTLMESDLQGEEYRQREREIAETFDTAVQELEDAAEAETRDIIRGQSGLTDEDWGNLATRNEANALYDLLYSNEATGDEKRAAVEGMSDALTALIQEYAPESSPENEHWLQIVADALDEIVGAKDKDLAQLDLTNAAEIYEASVKRGNISGETSFEAVMADIAETMTPAVEEAVQEMTEAAVAATQEHQGSSSTSPHFQGEATVVQEPDWTIRPPEPDWTIWEKPVLGPPTAEEQAQLEEKMEDAYTDIGDAGVEGLTDALDAGVPLVDLSSETLGDEAVAALQERLGIHSPSTVFRGIGVNTVEGLILGLEDKRAALLQKARELAMEVASTVREELDIHSPSKLFRGFGRNTAEGFALGIDDGMFRAQEALSHLADIATGGRSGEGRGAPIINVTLPNATIRSEKDAHELASQLASYINRVQRGYGG